MRGDHSKPCTLCGNDDWELGAYYYTDFEEPQGADKLCEECIKPYAEENDWVDSEAEEEYEDEGWSDEEEDEKDIEGKGEEQELQEKRYRIALLLPSGKSPVV